MFPIRERRLTLWVKPPAVENTDEIRHVCNRKIIRLDIIRIKGQRIKHK